jgi:hypothetical protein
VSETQTYDVGFKKPRSGRLVWVRLDAPSEREATRLAREHMSKRYEGKGYRLYAGPLLSRGPLPGPTGTRRTR